MGNLSHKHFAVVQKSQRNNVAKKTPYFPCFFVLKFFLNVLTFKPVLSDIIIILVVTTRPEIHFFVGVNVFFDIISVWQRRQIIPLLFLRTITSVSKFISFFLYVTGNSIRWSKGRKALFSGLCNSEQKI